MIDSLSTRPRFRIALGIVLGQLFTPLWAADISWNGEGADGHWFRGGNWNGGTTPKTTDNAYFDTDTFHPTVFLQDSDYVEIWNFNFGGDSSTYMFEIGTDGPATLAVGGVSRIGYASMANASVGVYNGSYWISDHIRLGVSTGTGTILVESGEARATTYMSLGSNSTAAGAIEVTGADSLLAMGSNLNAGHYGEGVVKVNDGGEANIGNYLRIGYFGSAYGEMTIDNGTVIAGSSDNGSDDAYVGFAGEGYLTVRNGGRLDVRDQLLIARDSGSHGEVLIENSTSRIAADDMAIGGSSTSAGGTGSLTMTDGTIAVTGTTKLWGSGALDISGGTFRTGNLETYGGGGSLSLTGGTLELFGGNWDVEGAAHWLIEATSGFGPMTVAYSGSTVTHTGHTLTIADQSDGVLSLKDASNGAATDFTAADVFMGTSGAHGEIHCDQGGAKHILRMETLTVGDPVSGGGSALIDLSNDAHFVTIGDAAGNRSTAEEDAVHVIDTINGTGIWLEANASLAIDASLKIGSEAGLAGRAFLSSGSGLSLIDAGDDLVIGVNGGTGELDQTSGSSVSLGGFALVGSGTGSEGLWNLAGASVGTMVIGEQGNGTVNLLTGETLDVTDDLYIGRDGGFGDLSLKSGLVDVGGAVNIGNGGVASGNLTITDTEMTVGEDFVANADDNSEIRLVLGSNLEITRGLYLGNTGGAVTSLAMAASAGNASTMLVGRNIVVEAGGELDIQGNSVLRVGDGSLTGAPTGAVLVSHTTTDYGTLEVAGGTVYLDPALLVGWTSGESGVLDLNGQDTDFNTYGAVRLGEAGDASVIMGQGVVWNAQGNSFEMATNGGSADILLTNGAELAIDSGILAGSTGGTATLDLKSGSRLSVTDDSALISGGDPFDITLDASTLSVGGMLTIGKASEVNVYLTGASSSIEGTDSVLIGSGAGGVGLLSLSGDADVDGLGDFVLASDDATAVGTLELKAGFDLEVLNLVAGNSGEGNVAVHGTGSVLTVGGTDTSEFVLGWLSGSRGKVEVYDGGAVVHSEGSSNFAAVGLYGPGDLKIYGNGSSASFPNRLRIGVNPDASGSLLEVSAGATLTGSHLDVNRTSTLTVKGAGTTLDLTGNLSLGSDGVNTFAADDGAILTLDGTLAIGTNNIVTLIGGATIHAMAVDGNLTNTSGVFSPGAGTAAVAFNGNYTQESAGKLLLQVGGTTAGTDHDTLTLTGNATLDGTVVIEFLNGYTPSGGESFALMAFGSFDDQGYALSLPALGSNLEWTVDRTSSALTLSVSFTKDLDGFRAQYGLNPDGSDDSLDWSGNGISNLLYLAFGLGDPNEADIDRSRLPAATAGTTEDTLTFTFVRPTANDTGLEMHVVTSTGLTTWSTPADLGTDYLPVSEQTEDLGDDYQRVTEIYPIQLGEIFRFYRVAVEVLSGS